MTMKLPYATALPLLVASTAAQAGQSVTYTYDAKGLIKTVTHSGSVNNGVQITYTHDKADNRSSVKTTGAPN